MGNGFTFPLETLVFYSLIKAVGDLSGCVGVYSVYGDDLIYPRKIHNIVHHVMDSLGIQINLDKTFVDSHFRESCGGDYYHGADVRPVILPDVPGNALSRSQYRVWLFKVINLLMRRWSPYEIPATIRLLLIEAAMYGELYRIPMHYPDTAGIKVHHPSDDFLMPMLPWSKIAVGFADGSQKLSFRYFAQTSKKRFITYQEPYYWLALKRESDNDEDSFTLSHTRPPSTELPRTLEWLKVPIYRTVYYNGRRKERIIMRLRPYVAERNSVAYNQRTILVADWAQER